MDQQMRILLGMAGIFVFCQFFPIVGDFHELICTVGGHAVDGICAFNTHIENCIIFSHFMLMVNSSVNFVFYMTNMDQFREGVLKVNWTFFYWQTRKYWIVLYIIKAKSDLLYFISRHFAVAFILVVNLKHALKIIATSESMKIQYMTKSMKIRQQPRRCWTLKVQLSR